MPDRELTCGWMVRRAVEPPALTRVQIPDLTLWCLPVDSEAPAVTSPISRPVGSVLRCSLLEVLIGVECACVRS
jgi:hypothetical protein